jgi:hypothetical protein
MLLRAAATAASSHNYLAHCQLYVDPDTRLLICCRPERGFALSTARSQVTTHLQEKYRTAEDLRKGLTHYLKHDRPYKFVDPAGVPPRLDGSDTDVIHPEIFNTISNHH